MWTPCRRFSPWGCDMEGAGDLEVPLRLRRDTLRSICFYGPRLCSVCSRSGKWILLRPFMPLRGGCAIPRRAVIELLCGKIQACEAEVEKIKALGNCRGLCVYVPGRSLLNIRCFGRAGSSSGYELDPCSARTECSFASNFQLNTRIPNPSKKVNQIHLVCCQTCSPHRGARPDRQHAIAGQTWVVVLVTAADDDLSSDPIGDPFMMVRSVSLLGLASVR